MELDYEASAAEAQGDVSTFLARMEEAVDLRPDVPRLLMKLAAAYVANGDSEAALATLQRIAAMGVSMPVAQEEEFAALRGTPEFEALVRMFTANTRPRGTGETVFVLREVTGLIEGIAWREDSDIFLFSDVNGRAVWTRNSNGTLQRFTPGSDELLGVFGLAVDLSRGVLWAAMSALPAMRDYRGDLAGNGALAEIDLDSGEIRRSIALIEPGGLPGLPLLADVAVGPDGAVYATGSATGIVWRLPPGGSVLELFAEGEELMSLEAITVLPEENALIVAERMHGLFRIDLAGAEVRRLEVPTDATVIGVTGLATAPSGAVLAIQNGTSPKRVLELQLEPGAAAVSALRVLESGHFTMAGPSQGCIGPGGHFYFIGNAGWHRFGDSDEPTEPRSLPIFRTKL